MKTRTRWIKLGLGAMALGVCVGLQAAAPVITNIVMVPRLTIQSDLGSTNQIQYSTNLGQTNWTGLTNLVVTASPYWFVDVAAPPAPFRFYRVIALEPIKNLAPTNMVFIPAGSFTMGDNLGDGVAGGWPDEVPLHTVYVSAFYMDKYDVTKAQWDSVYQWATNRPVGVRYSFDYAGSGKAANHPVQSITWYDMVKWCNARSEMEGKTPAYYTSAAQTTVYRTGQVNVDNSSVKWNLGYRLPTEAEWEKAARGGAAGQRFPWGNTISESQANYYSTGTNYDTYDLSKTGYNLTFNDGVGPYTSPAGYFAPNGYGLYDMAGNVWQWCWDWWDGSWYSNAGATQSDTRGPLSGSYRVHRGGCWGNRASVCRTAFRGSFNPANGDNGSGLGFRSVLPPGQ